MAVSFIGTSNLIATNGTAPGAITPHANTAVGDLLVWFHYSRATGGNETVSFPSGWNVVFNSVTANFGLVAVAWRNRATGDTSYTATITNHTSGTSGETVLEWIETYRGHESVNPIVHFTASLSTWPSSLVLGSIAAPATATVHDGDMVIVFAGRFENITAQTTLTGDNLVWAQNTRNDTTAGSDAGAVTQRGLNQSGSNQTVTQKSITTTGTAQAGAGRMFIIEAVPVEYTQNLSDTISFSDSPSKQIYKISVDNISLTDSAPKQIYKSSSDTISLTDSYSKQAQKSLSDAITVNDEVNKSIQKSVNDSFSVVDSLLKSVSKPVQDSVMLSDTHTKQFTKEVTDLVTFNDERSFTFSRVLDDAINIVDGIVKQIGKVASDAFTLIDTLFFGGQTFYVNLTDSISLSDSLNLNTSQGIVWTELKEPIQIQATPLGQRHEITHTQKGITMSIIYTFK